MNSEATELESLNEKFHLRWGRLVVGGRLARGLLADGGLSRGRLVLFRGRLAARGPLLMRGRDDTHLALRRLCETLAANGKKDVTLQ